MTISNEPDTTLDPAQKSPEARRDAILKMTRARTKTARSSIVILAVMGLVLLAGTIIVGWYVTHFDVGSVLGIISGLIGAGLGLRAILDYRVKSYRVIASEDFSEAEALAWMQEEQAVNERFSRQWNESGKYIVGVVAGVLMVLFAFNRALSFTWMALLIAGSVFLLGIAVLGLVPPRWVNKDSNKDQRLE